jgi:beta-lactamase regulating signal transducer with metallopeptidase domain
MSSTSNSTAEDAVNSLVSQLQSTYNSVSTKAVLSQLGIMGALSVSFQLNVGTVADEKSI